MIHNKLDLVINLMNFFWFLHLEDLRARVTVLLIREDNLREPLL